MRCEYCAKGIYGETIIEKDYWTIFLAPSQRYLGTCVIALKRQCSNLSGLNPHEWQEFSIIVPMIEFALESIFKPTLFNWSCFKNATFREKHPDPQVHWHLIPRYDHETEYHNIKFEDPDFGYIPQPLERKIPEEVMKEMVNEINNKLSRLSVKF